MYSLFTEASRDVQAEEAQYRRELISSRLDNGGALALMVTASSKEEYEHYKAIARETLEAIAHQYDSTYDEVESILDQKMAYHFEALDVAKESAYRDKEYYVIIDGNGKRIGGSYRSRESAQEAISSGRVKSASGLRIIPASAFRMTSSIGEPQGSEKKTATKQEGVNPFQVLAGLKRALQEGVNPLEWTEDVNDGEPVGNPSKHNDGPNKVTSANENPNSPIPPASDYRGGTANIGGEIPTQDSPMTTDVSHPVQATSSADDRYSSIVQEIARYNPHLSEQRIAMIAGKVMARFDDIEEDREE